MKPASVKAFLALTLLVLTGCGGDSVISVPPVPAQSFVYVGNFSDRTIEVFSVKDISETLAPVQAFSVATPPVALASHASGKFLYYTDSLQVFALSVGADGKLASIGSPLDAGVGCVSLERVGNFVYAGCSMRIAAYKIKADGTLSTVAGSPFLFPLATKTMSVDPNGKALFVVDNGGTVSGYLRSFTLNVSTGAVTPGSGDQIFGNAILTSSSIDSTGTHLFVVSSSTLGGPVGDVLNEYSIGPDASLTFIPSLALEWTPDQIAPSPSDSVLYISYQVNPRIQSYTIDSNWLVRKTSYSQAVPLPPFRMKVDASGKLLVAALNGNQGVMVFPVDSSGNISPSMGTFLQGKTVYAIESLMR
ncbi:MAG TPA: hypothetical protein VF135_08820 [Terriglobales bacterium]